MVVGLRIIKWVKLGALVLVLASLVECIRQTGEVETVTDKFKDGSSLIRKFKDENLIDSFMTDSRGRITGIRFYVDSIDSIKIYSEYVNGRINGFQSGMGMKNNLIYNLTYRNDSVVGEGFYYYPNGKIRLYQFRSYYDGKLVYECFYDSNGNINRSEGRGLVQFNRLKDTVKVGEEYVGEAIVAHPPRAKTVLMFADYVNDSMAKNHVISEGADEIRAFVSTPIIGRSKGSIFLI